MSCLAGTSKGLAKMTELAQESRDRIAYFPGSWLGDEVTSLVYSVVQLERVVPYAIDLRGGIRGARIQHFQTSEEVVHVFESKQLVRDKLMRIRQLEDGWRGPGSVAPSAAAVALYEDLFSALNTNVEVRRAEPTPTADGGLNMEWVSDGREFAVEILSSGDCAFNVFDDDESQDVEVIAASTATDLATFIREGKVA